MAKRMKTWLTDDKEAAAGNDVEADQTVIFGLDGKNFEIDLCAKNATKMRTEIEQWMQYARPIGAIRQRKATAGRGPGRPRSTAPASDDGMDSEQRKACREWLRNNGWPNLAARGRIPAEAMAAFHERPSVA